MSKPTRTIYSCERTCAHMTFLPSVISIAPIQKDLRRLWVQFNLLQYMYVCLPAWLSPYYRASAGQRSQYRIWLECCTIIQHFHYYGMPTQLESTLYTCIHMYPRFPTTTMRSKPKMFNIYTTYA
jgi:hypothetical protein